MMNEDQMIPEPTMEAPAETNILQEVAETFDPLLATYEQATDAGDDFFSFLSAKDSGFEPEGQFAAREEAPAPEAPADPAPAEAAPTPELPTEQDPYLALAKQLKDNPLLAAQVVQAMQQQQPQAQAAPEEEVIEEEPLPELPARPSRPQKPEGYDHQEALADPQSASGRYFLAMQEYAADMADYNAAVDDRQAIVQERQAEYQQQQVAYQQYVDQLTGVAREVMSLGASQEETKAFLSWAQQPTYDTKTLYSFYQHLHSTKGQAAPPAQPARPAVAQKAAEMRQLQQRPAVPVPSTAAPGEAAQRDPVDSFFEAIQAEYNKQNPFN
jgi:hypothetical protein